VRVPLAAGVESSYAPAAATAEEDIMRHSEYERRRRALEEQLHADLELIRAGYQAKLRSLEMLWLASPEPGAAADAPRAAPSSETLADSETPAEDETLADGGTPAPPPVPARSPSVRRGRLLEDVEKVLPDLPGVFARADVIRVLGFDPPRATLHRVFSQLLMDQRIAVAEYSDGYAPTRYRKT
jgi:hypothetical protein